MATNLYVSVLNTRNHYRTYQGGGIETRKGSLRETLVRDTLICIRNGFGHVLVLTLVWVLWLALAFVLVYVVAMVWALVQVELLHGFSAAK